jgi:methylated-DNA-protein-cysteine methyltransferase-like protein
MSVNLKLSEQHKDFFEQVYEIVRLIPEGKVTSYGAIAEVLGRKGSARMVGWAMNAAHQQKKYVPAHRVVNRNGLLTGKHHFSDAEEMQRLLEKENVEIKEDRIVNFKAHFWDPIKSLNIL